MRRLLPAATATVVVTLLMSWVLLSPLEQIEVAKSARAASAYLSDVRFALRSTDYLAEGGNTDPFLHTWSLAVEEQFYLLWPVMVGAGLFASLRRNTLQAIMWITGGASLAASVIFTWKAQPLAFFLVPFRWWEFCIGGLLAVSQGRLKMAIGPLADYFALLGLIALLASAVILGPRTPFPGAAAALPVLTTALLLELPASRWAARILESKPLQFLGRLSYSWYLWHWPFLVFAWTLYPGISVPVRAAIALAALGTAWVSYRTIENPLRKHRRLLTHPRLSVGLGLGLTVLAVAVGTSSLAAAKRASSSNSQARFMAARREMSKLYTDGCLRTFLDASIGSGCVYGDTTARTSVVLFGDSHAAQWFPPLEAIARAERWRLIVLTKSSCPAATVTVTNRRLNRKYVECDVWRSQALRRIEQVRPAIVIMTSSTAYLDTRETERRNVISQENWQRGTISTARRLSNASGWVLIVRDVPHPRFDVPVCLSRAEWSLLAHGDCSFNRDASLVSGAIAAEDAAARATPRTSILDVTHHVCPSETCPGARNGMVIFRDTDHLTTQFASRLLVPLRHAIEAGSASHKQDS